MKLFYWYLLDSSFVATALEWSLEELVHDFLGCLVVDETSWHNEDVGIVMLADKAGNIFAPCQTGTYALVFVESHCHSLAAAADGYAWIALSALYSLCQRMGKVWIVTTCIAVSSEILILIALRLQILDNKLLQWKSRVVTCQTDCLYVNSR